MAPSEHIEWFEDNISWFEQIDLTLFDTPVPACPGWNVEYVLNHLSFGLGLAYPAAMDQPPSTDPETVFADVDFPSVYPTGDAVRTDFTTIMGDCATAFRNTAPDTPCWTYAGGGIAAFWFRRAAIETSLHRMDVAEALGIERHHLTDERARNAIEETLEFALPFAGTLTNPPDGPIRIISSCLEGPLVAGDEAETRTANVEGSPHDVLATLWGRRDNEVTVSGDEAVADQWLGLIANAFSGR